jgi:hypothetical protein
LKTDLALVSSAQFDYVAVFRADYMETTFFLTLLAFVDSFQDDVGFAGLFDGNHLHLEVVCPCDHPGEGILADFALELGEIVGDDHSADFLLHLAVDPCFEALDMHTFAGSLALAGSNHEVIGSTVVAQTDLAVAWDCLRSFMDSV